MASKDIPPVCQLLQRQSVERYQHWILVGVPVAVAQACSPAAQFWVTDLISAEILENRGQQVHLGVESPSQAAPGVLLFWPKSHALGIWWLQALCHWLPEGTPIDIVGEHQGGIKRVPKVLEEAGMSSVRLDNARRCSLFSTQSQARSQPPEGWSSYAIGDLTLASHPGVFANHRLDEGTALLLQQLEQEFAAQFPATAIDVGCGDGIIAAWLAQRASQVTAVDADAFAVAATQKSLELNGLDGNVMLSDMLSGVSGQFDAIVSNPPFHQSRDIDYGPARRMIADAAAHLCPGGKLYIVANAFLPYRAQLEENFERVDTLLEDGRYRIYRAGSPRRKR